MLSTVAVPYQISSGTAQGSFIWPWVQAKENSISPISVFIEGLDASKLQFVEITGSDSLSKLGEYWLTFDYPEAELDPQTVLFAKVGVLYDVTGVNSNEEYQTSFTGVVGEIYQPLEQYSHPATQQQYYRYQIKIIPKLAFLHYHVDSRIFVSKTIQQILSAILQGEHGLTNDDFVLDFDPEGIAATFKLVNYIQYEESDWLTLQRLLMKAGIYFYTVQHCTASGEITHVMHFTDKKPGLLAQAPQALSLAKPNYYTTFSNNPKDFVGCFSWRSMNYPSVAAVAVEGFDATQPSQALLSQQRSATRQVSVTNHPHFGHYRPQQNFTAQPDGEKFAEVILDRYTAFQNQAQLSFNVPGYALMQKFTLADLDRQGFANQASGAKASDYLVIERTFRISLLPSANGYYASPEFTVRVIPLSQQTTPLCPNFNLPPAEVTRVELDAVVVDSQGQYEGDAVKQGRVPNDNNLREFYVAFRWDQAKRTQQQANLTPVPARYFTNGLANMPPVGSCCLVKFSSGVDGMPTVIGANSFNNNFQPYNHGNGAANELVLMAQPVDATQPVNAIVLDDSPDKPSTFIIAPGQVVIQAAQSDETSAVQLTIDKEFFSVLTAQGVFFEIKEGAIHFGNNNANLGIDKEGNVSINGQEINVKSMANTTFTSAQQLSASANTGVALTSEAFVNVNGEVITIDSQTVATITAEGGVSLS